MSKTKKYLVYVKIEAEYEIEAENEEHALDIAYDYLVERDFDDYEIREITDENE